MFNFKGSALERMMMKFVDMNSIPVYEHNLGFQAKKLKMPYMKGSSVTFKDLLMVR